MKLRPRILLWMSLTLALMILGVYVTSSRHLLSSYRALERQDAEQNVERASRAFVQLSDSLHNKSVDWAHWDDTFVFMKDRNKEYIKSNLIADSLVSLNIDLIMFIDTRGKMFYRFAIKRLIDLPRPDPALLARALGFDRLDSPGLRTGTDFSGVVQQPKAPMIVSVRRILPTVARGPHRGWLVFARYFDTGELQRLGERTRLNIVATTLNMADTPPDATRSAASLSDARPVRIEPDNAETISGYTRVMDVNQQPALLMRVSLPRRIYQQGLESSTNLIRMLILAALVFSIVTIILLDRSVLARLTRLTSQVESIGIDGQTGLSVDAQGSDELAGLATRINSMLRRLQEAARHVQERSEHLSRQNQALESRERELISKAFHDTLTGLPNRAHALLQLTHMAVERNGGAKAVLFIDLDNFKFINDSLGHTAGDELLIAVTTRLKVCVRPEDVVARIGGDEFIVILNHLNAVEIAVEVAQRILNAMVPEFALTGGSGYTSASVGIAYTEDTEIDPDALIHKADTAMYHAKLSGKSRYAIYESGMTDKLTERIDVEGGLRSAFENEEFRIHYQPAIDLKTGLLTGVEALVRWQHAKHGLVAPDKFLAVAEETGLIIPLGYWVLQEACRQAAAWRDEHPSHAPFCVCVNLSGKQLSEPDIAPRIQQILAEAGLPPEQLELDIAESVLHDDLRRAMAALAELKAIGVRLALDDFGTGFASLSSLDSFPFDAVKMAISFVSRMNTHPEAGVLVATMIVTAKSLNMQVMAKGIESVDQVTSLQGLGCEIGQGYFFARPMAVADMDEKLAHGFQGFARAYADGDKELIEGLLVQAASPPLTVAMDDGEPAALADRVAKELDEDDSRRAEAA